MDGPVPASLRSGVSGCCCPRSHSLLRSRRQRIDGWRGRWPAARGFSGLKSFCPGLRRHSTAGFGKHHFIGNGVERWSRQRQRRRHKRFLRPPELAGGAKVPPSKNPGGRIGRGVPDVAGDADPETGYFVIVDGQEAVIGGTSAVAPLWAGLMVRFNQKLGASVGYLNPLLTASSAPTCTTSLRVTSVPTSRPRDGTLVRDGEAPMVGSCLLTSGPSQPPRRQGRGKESHEDKLSLLCFR